MQHDYEERSYMTGIVVSVFVSDTLLLSIEQGEQGLLGGVQLQLRVFFCFFSLVFFYYFILLLCYVLPIHHCHIYCLMMTTCDMMHICSHYC